jgi:hypothetical protein
MTLQSVIYKNRNFLLTFDYISYGFGTDVAFSGCYLDYLAIHRELRTRLVTKKKESA